MSNCKISIIIAVYNIQDYIIPCLESCASQQDVTNDDYEVIIVNDGATDNSPRLIAEFISDKPSFRMVTRPNGGLSVARNTGLSVANGDYVWFVDGDDAIAPNAVSSLLSKIRLFNSDAIICNFYTFDDDGIIDKSQFNTFLPCSGKEIHNKYLRVLPMMAWLTIYRTNNLIENGLYFLPGILHEDKEFSIRAHHCMKSINQIDDALYYYRISRKGSIMSEIRKDNTKSLVSEIKIIDSFSVFFKNEDTTFVRMIMGICATTFFIRRYDAAFMLNEITSGLLKKNRLRLYKLMLESGQWKRRVLLLFIIIMPSFLLKRIMPQIGNRSKLM